MTKTCSRCGGVVEAGMATPSLERVICAVCRREAARATLAMEALNKSASVPGDYWAAADKPQAASFNDVVSRTDPPVPSPVDPGRTACFTPTTGVPREHGRRVELPTIPNYDILGVVGRGGMGVVLKARDTRLGRLVAIKMPTISGEAIRKRFLREARSAAQLRHPNICAIHEVGEVDGEPYMIMDFIEGETLKDAIDRELPPTLRAAKIALVTARAVAYAHERGVIHRDLKPANVILEQATGDPMIMDFGLAKEASAVESELTCDGDVLGTPAYMSPEQAAGKHDLVGQRSDVYSLGAMLYHLLTGQRPFIGTVTEILKQVQLLDPISPLVFNRKIPRDLETICLKAMARRLDDRYASAQAMAEDLARYCAGEPILSRRISWLERAARWIRRRPLLSSLVTAAVLMLMIGGLFAWQGVAERRVSRLLSAIEAGMASDTWDPAHLERMEALASELEAVEPDQAFVVRRRIADRFAESIRGHLGAARLEADAVKHVHDDLSLLSARDSRSTRLLEDELSRRLARWETVVELTAPFTGVEAVLPKEKVNVAEGTLTGSESQPPLWFCKTQVACPTSTELDVEFDKTWRSAAHLGVRLNQTERDGYEFCVRPGSQNDVGRVDDMEEPASLAEAETRRWPAVMLIHRDGVLLGRSVLPLWELPAGPLRIRARRAGDTLSFWVNEGTPLVIEDVFSLSPAEPGFCGLLWPSGVGIRRLSVRRLNSPAVASPLEKADAHFQAARFADALDAYLEAGKNASIATVRQEADYKAGLCLAKLKRDVEAAAIWSRTILEPGDRWPPLAGCLLLLQRLREKNRPEADLLLERLAIQHQATSFARLLPADVRASIVAAYQPRGAIFLITDREVLERQMKLLELLRIFWDPSRPDGAAVKDLIVAHWMLGELPQAIEIAKEMVDSLGEHYFDGERTVATEWFKYYAWLVRMAQGPEAGLAALDKTLRVAAGKRRSSAIALDVERARYLCSLKRFEEAERLLSDYIQAVERGVDAIELVDAYLVYGFSRSLQGDEAGAKRRWREGLEAFRKKRQRISENAIRGQLGGTHLAYYPILGALVDDWTESDVRFFIERNLEPLKAGNSVMAVLVNARLRDQVFSTESLRSAMAAGWRSPEGRQIARQLAFHELGFADHAQVPVLLLFKQLLAQSAFLGEPSEAQRALSDQAVKDLLTRFFLGDMDATQAMGLALAWKGQLIAVSWESIQKALEDRRDLRAPLSYILAHRMLRLRKPESAEPLFAAAQRDAAAGSPLAKLVREDWGMLKQKKGRLALETERPGGTTVRLTRVGQTPQKIEVKPKLELTLDAGDYTLEMTDPAGGSEPSPIKIKLLPVERVRIDVGRLPKADRDKMSTTQ